MIKEQLYIRLKKLRQEKKLSQNDVAEYLHISRQSVSQWETGKSYPDIDNLILLSKLYDVSLNEMLAICETSKIDVQNNDGLTEESNIPVGNTNAQLSLDQTVEYSGNSKWMEDIKSYFEILSSFILLGLTSQIPILGVILPFVILWRTSRSVQRKKIIYIACLIGLVLGIYNTYAMLNHYFMPDIGTSIIDSM